MNIKKYLKKINIDVQQHGNDFLFIMADKTEKHINKKQLEQYLFICLLDYVEEFKK